MLSPFSAPSVRSVVRYVTTFWPKAELPLSAAPPRKPAASAFNVPFRVSAFCTCSAMMPPRVPSHGMAATLAPALMVRLASWGTRTTCAFAAAV